MKNDTNSRVNEVEFSLSLCTAIQISLVRLLESWGIRPDVVTGHSSGEAAAAFAAGAITMKEALAIAWNKGTLTEDFQKRLQRKGGMLAVGMRREAAQALLDDITSGMLVVACVNSPTSVTISGDLPAIAEAEAKLVGMGVFVRRLKVDTAYHSAHMEAFAGPYMEHLEKVLSNTGDFNGVAFSSSTTGQRITHARELGPSYWVKNMVQPVEFVDAFTNMCLDGEKAVDMVVEIGPHGALAGPIRQILETETLEKLSITYLPSLTRKQDAVMAMQKLVSVLVSRNYPVNIGAVNAIDRTYQPETLYDLPHYPWNHQTRYWTEPRVNRLYRQREFPKNDLLGVRIVGLDPKTPAWRHFIRQADMPWIKDHQVQSTVIYPAAGYICMAIEGLSQLLRAHTKSFVGCQLRQVNIKKALVVPDNSHGVETQLRLRSCDKDPMLGSEGWYEFRISSVTATDEWLENCQGYITLTNTTVSKDWVTSREIDSRERNFLETGKIQPEDMFKVLRNLGIHHGPTFQNLIDISRGDNQSLVRLSAGRTADLESQIPGILYNLHPITLDSIIVSAFTALPDTTLQQQTAMLPCSIASVIVQSNDWHATETELQCYSTITRHNSRGFSSSSLTSKQVGSQCVPVVEINNLEFQVLHDSVLPTHNEKRNNSCSTINWGEDLAHTVQEDWKQRSWPAVVHGDHQTVSELELAASYFIREALASLSEYDTSCLDGHLRRLFEWMLQHEKLCRKNSASQEKMVQLLSRKDQIDCLKAFVSNRSVSGKMLCRIGENMVSILKGTVNALELMTEGDLLYRYYKEDIRIKLPYIQVQEYLRLYVHKYPRARILEVGAGAGGFTIPALQVLGGGSPEQPALFSHYSFTDISDGFLHRARQMFTAWGQLMEFKKFDLEVDPTAQSFEAASFDLILAGRSLHATKEITKTLSYLRKLLKPDGKLIIVEDTQDFLDHQLIYGVLPGWWVAEEEHRRNSPHLSVSSWNKLLQQCGFMSIELELSSSKHSLYPSSTLMVSSARGDSLPSYDPGLIVTYGTSCPPTMVR